jgi:hypothetical protein
MPQRSAAGQIYPHLPSAERTERPERKGSVGDAMWPQLSREQRATDAAQALWARINKRNIDNFLKAWRAERGR